jgi:hypothetical protein
LVDDVFYDEPTAGIPEKQLAKIREETSADFAESAPLRYPLLSIFSLFL